MAGSGRAVAELVRLRARTQTQGAHLRTAHPRCEPKKSLTPEAYRAAAPPQTTQARVEPGPGGEPRTGMLRGIVPQANARGAARAPEMVGKPGFVANAGAACGTNHLICGQNQAILMSNSTPLGGCWNQ